MVPSASVLEALSPLATPQVEQTEEQKGTRISAMAGQGEER